MAEVMQAAPLTAEERRIIGEAQLPKELWSQIARDIQTDWSTGAIAGKDPAFRTYELDRINAGLRANGGDEFPQVFLDNHGDLQMETEQRDTGVEQNHHK